MAVTVQSRLRRTLAKLSRFEVMEPSMRGVTIASCPPLLPDEEVLGVYHNQGSTSHEDVYVTSLGLRMASATGWRTILFADITEVVLPHVEDKDIVDTLHIRLRGGSMVSVLVRGGTKRFRDAWEFFRFLQRVVSDLSIDGVKS